MNLQNLVDYCQEFDLPSIWQEVVVPDKLNKEEVISAIMIRCGLLTPVYNQPSVFRQITGSWFRTHEWNFNHLIAIMEAEYSPIENVDRYDDQMRETSGNENTGGNVHKTGNENNDRTIKTDYGKNGDDTTTNTVSPFNSGSFQNDNKSERNWSETGSDDTEDNAKKTIDENTSSIQDTKRSGTDHFVQHLHGNIGVTTNQTMINQEIALIESFNVYSKIAEMFEKDMMICVY